MLSELNDIPESLRALALELDELEGPPASGPDDDALPDLDGTDFRPLRLLAWGRSTRRSSFPSDAGLP